MRQPWQVRRNPQYGKKRKAGRQVRPFHTGCTENKCSNNGMRVAEWRRIDSRHYWGQGRKGPASAIRLAVKRAVDEQLAKLEREAESKANSAEGRGKQRKGRDPMAIKFHSDWARRFHFLRTGKVLPDPTDLLPEIIVGEIR